MPQISQSHRPPPGFTGWTWVFVALLIGLLAACTSAPVISTPAPTAPMQPAALADSPGPGAYVAWGVAENAVPPTREPSDPLAPGNEILGIDCLTYLGSGGDVGISGVWDNRWRINWAAYDACINAAAKRTVRLADGRTVAQPVILTLPSTFSDTGSRWYRTGGQGAPGSATNPYIRLHLPRWMQTDVYRFTFQVPGSGNYYQSIRYDGPFKQRMIEFVRAAGARYNSNPQIAAVRVAVGVQGESQPVVPCQPYWDASLPAGGDGLACRGDRPEQVLAEHEKVVSCDAYMAFVREVAEAAQAAFPDKPVVAMADAGPCQNVGSKQFRSRLYANHWSSLPIGISMNNINTDRQDADERAGNSLAAWAKYATGRTLAAMGYPMMFEYDAHRPSPEGMYWTTLSGAGNGGSYILHHSTWNTSYTALMWDVIDHWLASDRRGWIVFRDREYPTYDFAASYGTSGSIGDWGKHLTALNPEVAPQACEPKLQSVARAANTVAARARGINITPACPGTPLPTPAVTPAATPSPGPDQMNRLFNRQARRLPADARLELAVSDDWALYGRAYPVTVTVSYLDIGTDTFTVSLPDAAGLLRGHVIRKEDTGLWQRHTWTQNALIANPDDGGAFAAIANDGAGDEYLHELYFDVAVEQVIAPVAPFTPTATRTLTPTPRPTQASSLTPSVTLSVTPSATPSITPTASPTSSTPNPTSSPTPPSTPTATATETATPTLTATATRTGTPSFTATVTSTTPPTATRTPSATPSRTSTATASPTPAAECGPVLDSSVRLGAGVKTVAAGSDAFYVGLFDSSELLRVDAAGRMTWRVATGQGRTNGVAVSGEIVVTTNRDRGTVTLHRAATGAVIATLNTGSLPWGVAADGNRAYVANFGSGTVTIVDLAAAKIVTTVPVGQQPVTTLAHGGRVYVLHLNGALYVLDANGQRLNQGTVPLAGARGLALDPDRGRLYLTGDSGRVFLLDAGNLAEIARLTLPGPAYAALVNPLTGRLFAVDPQNNRLYALDPEDRQGTNVRRWTLPAQDATQGGQGIAVLDGRVAVADYAAGSLTFVDDPACAGEVTPAARALAPRAGTAADRLADVTATATGTAAPARTATSRPTLTRTPARTATRAPTATVPPTPAGIRAKIEIIWPHGGADVRDADLANITAYLIQMESDDAPPCDWNPTVRLWAARNVEPARAVATGEKRMLAENGRRYPVWDFNDVDVSAARDPANKLAFFVTVDGVTTYYNIWTHAADARTVFAQPDVPSLAVRWRPTVVDARIEIVWPHDSAAITEAELANVSAYLFTLGGKQAFSSDLSWRPVVRLHRTLNNDTEQPDSTVIGAPRVVTAENGVRFLAWDFNDVDISLARDPLNQIFFWVSVDGTTSFSNIWAHGIEPRTLFPQPDVLNSCK